MNTSSAIQITLNYRLIEQLDWQSQALSVEEYFDLELDEPVSLDACPQHNHAIDYLDLPVEQVQATQLTLVDPQAQTQRTIVEKFWNQGKNRIIERTDRGAQPYSETILEIQISQEPAIWEILRREREQGTLTPLDHAFVQDHADGSQTETIVQDVGLRDRPISIAS
jgi:hypothetical protein